MSVVAAAGFTASWYAWEQRAQVVPAIAGNSVALVSIGVTLVIGAMALIAGAVVSRADRKGDQVEAILQAQVTHLGGRVLNLEEERLTNERRFAETRSREELCQRNLTEAQRQLKQMLAVLHKHGLMQLRDSDSEWGSLT